MSTRRHFGWRDWRSWRGRRDLRGPVGRLWKHAGRVPSGRIRTSRTCSGKPWACAVRAGIRAAARYGCTQTWERRARCARAWLGVSRYLAINHIFLFYDGGPAGPKFGHAKKSGSLRKRSFLEYHKKSFIS